MPVAGSAADGDEFPAASVTAPFARPSVTVPSAPPVWRERVTVYGPAPLPERPVTDHPLAVPPIVKSPVSRPVTGSLKVTV